MTTMEAIPTAGVTLAGDLTVPQAVAGAVVFAHAGPNDLIPRTPQITAALDDAANQIAAATGLPVKS